VPVVAKSPEEAAQHFGFLGFFVGVDCPASSAQTQERLGWRPTNQPGLIAVSIARAPSKLEQIAVRRGVPRLPGGSYQLPASRVMTAIGTKCVGLWPAITHLGVTPSAPLCQHRAVVRYSISGMATIRSCRWLSDGRPYRSWTDLDVFFKRIAKMPR
jgi:hypothetical protein